jgi:HD superfamily phosphohydrolase
MDGGTVPSKLLAALRNRNGQATRLQDIVAAKRDQRRVKVPSLIHDACHNPSSHVLETRIAERMRPTCE